MASSASAIGGGGVFGAAGIVQGRVLRADRGIVETGGDGMGEGDLAVVVLQNIGVGALQNAGRSAAEARGVLAERRRRGRRLRRRSGGPLRRG